MHRTLAGVAAFLLCTMAFAQGSPSVDSPFVKPIGKSMDEVVARFGKPIVWNKDTRGGNVFHTLFYAGYRLSIWDSKEQSVQRVAIAIYDPSFMLSGNVHVGDRAADVMRVFGEPTGKGETYLSYVSEKHSLVFGLDRDGQVISISWSYLLD